MYKKALIGILLGAVITIGGYCQDVDKLRSQREKSLSEINKTEELLKQTQANKKNELQHLNLTKNKIKERNKVISGISNEITILDQQIKGNEATIGTLKTEIEKLKEDYGKVIYRSYLNRNSYHQSQYIFAAADFNQAYKRLKYMQQYTRFRKAQAEKIEHKTYELKEINTKQEENKNQRNELLISEQREKAKLNNDKKDQEQSVKNLTKQEKKVKKELDTQKANFKMIERSIEKAIAAATGSERSSGGMHMTPEEKIVSNEFSKNRGRLPWPVTHGVVSMGFGKQDVLGQRGVVFDNNGINIVTQDNAVVYSVFEGVVEAISVMPGGILLVLIRHGEYFSAYLYISDLKIKVRDHVKIKQEIGRATHNGKDGNPEFNFQIWKGMVKQDPENWLSK